jgi:hypothetical protein
MTLAEFQATLADAAPPGLPAPALIALWHDGRNDWQAAHAVAQDIDDDTGAWVHAYLHRKEGDATNAAYWYKRARHPVSSAPLADEWASIIEALLRAEQ